MIKNGGLLVPKNKLPLVSSSVAIGLLILNQPLLGMNLSQALDLAFQNDPIYQSAVYENAAANQVVGITRAALRPNISVNYNRSINDAQRTITTNGAPNKDSPNYVSESTSLTLRQPLINMEALARYRQGAAQADYSDAVLAGRTQELMTRLFSAYIDALYAQDLLRLATAQRSALKENQIVNARMFEKGAGTTTDLAETQARFELANAQALEAEDNVDSTRRKLLAITGPTDSPLDQLTNQISFLPLQPERYEAWEEIALSSNAEIVAQRHLVTAAEQDIKRTQAGHLPRLDLVAGLTKATADSLLTFNQEYTSRSIGVQLSIPIYGGGGVNAAVSQSRSNLDKTKSDLNLRINSVQVELRKQFKLIVSGQARIDALTKAEQAALLLIEATKKSMLGGLRINLDLLNAEQQLFTTRRDLAQARYGYLLAHMRLRYTAGMLSSEDIQRMNAYFAPAP